MEKKEKTAKTAKTAFEGYLAIFRKELPIGESFDLLERKLIIGGRRASFFFVDGLHDSDKALHLFKYLLAVRTESMTGIISSEEFLERNLPFMEAEIADVNTAITKLYTGLVPLIVEGLDKIIIMDARSYPARAVEEPEKEKTLRGAKDGFTETLMANIGLIRRRIRDKNLIFKAYNVGSAGKNDVALAYMKDRADMDFVGRMEGVLSKLDEEAKPLAVGGKYAAEGEEPFGGKNSAEPNGKGKAEQAVGATTAEGEDPCGGKIGRNAGGKDAAGHKEVFSGKNGGKNKTASAAATITGGKDAAATSAAATDSALTVSDQSLLEKLLREFGAGSGINPFPRVRYSQRPDVIAAHINEGKLAIIVDNSPTVMLVPTGIFEFFQDVDDYYFPPLTGNYFRFIKLLNFFVILFLTPVYYLIAEYDEFTPRILSFFVPESDFAIPIFWQLMLLEIAVDGLKLASLNTPDSLGASLSVIGALILGEFSVESGWFIPQTILCMAVVALAAFTQPSIEFSYAMKFCRIIMLIAAYSFGAWGLAAATFAVFVLMGSTKTLPGGSYLYPLIPFDAKILKRLIFRTQK